MLTTKNIFPLFVLGLFALSASKCEQQAAQTEAQFIEKEIYETEMKVRVNGVDDLLHFSALQALQACQDDCAKQEEAVQLSKKRVAEMEGMLEKRGFGIKPPPPCPCETGNCLWERFAVFSYFVNLDQYSSMPNVSLQTVNGQELTSSAKATVKKSPEGNYALVKLPQVEFKDDAVKMVIKSGGEAAEVLVNIK